MYFELTIAPQSNTQHKPCAWFIAGSHPQTWLTELARWGVPLRSYGLLVVPDPGCDRRIAGVLVTLIDTNRTSPGVQRQEALGKRGQTPGSDPVFHGPAGSLAVPYGCLAMRLFLPCDSRVLPAVSETELASLLPVGDSQFVWHPSAGLIRFERNDVSRVIDLLQPLEPKPSRWDRAIPGVSFSSRLISIEPTEELSAEQVLQTAGGEIGVNDDSLDSLPPTPGEGIAGKIYDLTKPLRNAWDNFTKGRGGSAPGRERPASADFGMLGSLSSLFRNAFPKSLIDQAARLREIDRLMHALKTDPDAGLKFALPISGVAAGRGRGLPTNQLGSRDVNFGLNSLFSSQPGDPWSIPLDQQLQLTQMYRELAMREVRMGRHRRAAYIYAHLLGNLQSAAMTLEAGGHYREAAALFRDRLARRQDAARCLALGGLFDEAAELYIEVGMIEEAANLYIRLRRHAEAEQLLRRWANQLTSEGHFIRASEIVHGKLNDLDGAIDVLDKGWSHNGADAVLCQDRLFALLSEFSRHADASRRVGALLQSSTSGSRHTSVAKVLSTVARNYVDQAVRDKAADATRVVVARRLQSAHPSESNSLIGAIRSLAPQDRLLARDCDRYVRNHTPRTPRLAKPRPDVDVIAPVRTIPLPDRDVEWQSAKSNSEAMYITGFSRDVLVLRRIPWADPTVTNQVVSWTQVNPDRRLLFDVAERDRDRRVMIHSVGAPPLESRRLLIESATDPKSETAGSPTWASASTLEFTGSNNGVPFAWRVRTNLGILEVTGFNPHGDEITNYSWNHPMPDIDPALIPITICASATPIRIGVASFLFHPINPMTSAPYIQLEYEIDSLENYRDAQHDCVMALFGVGGVMIREPFYNNSPQPIAEGLESPHGLFLYGGRIVVAGRDECRVYRFQSGRVHQVGNVKLDAPAIAVMRTDHVAQFAVLCRDGNVRVFELR